MVLGFCDLLPESDDETDSGNPPATPPGDAVAESDVETNSGDPAATPPGSTIAKGDVKTNSGDPAATPPGRAAAVVRKSKIWEGRQALKVCFLNPGLLTEWGLETETIIEWANGTKDSKGWEEVMVFQKTERINNADIRVQFSGD